MLEVEAGTQESSVRVGGEWLCCLLVCVSVSPFFFFITFCVYDNDMIWEKIKVTFYFVLLLREWGKIANPVRKFVLSQFWFSG